MTLMDTRDVATAYFDAWQTRDPDRFRALLADDVTWQGPTWRAGNADECVAAFQRASSVVTRVDIQHLWADGADAVTWFQMHKETDPPTPVANWTHVENGVVTRVRTTLDLLPPTSAPAEHNVQRAPAIIDRVRHTPSRR